MPSPYNGDQKSHPPHNPSDPPLSGTVSTTEHCLCGVTGLLITVAIISLFYPTLVAVTRPLQFLSSTAVVVILVMIWIVTWFGLELAWEWRAGRLTPDS